MDVDLEKTVREMGFVVDIDPRYKAIRDEISKERRKELAAKFLHFLGDSSNNHFEPVWAFEMTLKDLNTAELIYFTSFVSGAFLNFGPMRPEIINAVIEGANVTIDKGLD